MPPKKSSRATLTSIWWLELNLLLSLLMLFHTSVFSDPPTAGFPREFIVMQCFDKVGKTLVNCKYCWSTLFYKIGLNVMVLTFCTISVFDRRSLKTFCDLWNASRIHERTPLAPPLKNVVYPYIMNSKTICKRAVLHVYFAFTCDIRHTVPHLLN